MARLVTRVTSKNFCLINPSFELSAVTDLEGIPMVQVTGGQACINGMDIIATQDLRIYMPDEAKTMNSSPPHRHTIHSRHKLFVVSATFFRT